jgi:hypothetical protein
MATKKEAAEGEPLTAKNGGVLVGRDFLGNPIYAASADKPTATQSPNDRDTETK